jgi:hypothetical protein
MDARPAEFVGLSHQFQPIRAQQNAPATSLDSALMDLRIPKNLKPSRFRTYAKTGEGLLRPTIVPKREPRFFNFYRYFAISLLHYFASPSSKGRYLVTSSLLYFSLSRYTHSLSLHTRSHTC